MHCERLHTAKETGVKVHKSLVIIGLLFFTIGFITWINAILIPYFKLACELNNARSMLVVFAFYISYFIMAIPVARYLERYGIKTGIMTGLWLLAFGALIFIPAALTRTYWIFLSGLLAFGMGLAILQPAANTFITLIEPRERAAQRMSIMGVCNKSAGIIAPLILAAILLKPSDNDLQNQLQLMDDITRNKALDELVRRVILPYSAMAVILFLFGLSVRLSDLPEITFKNDITDIDNSGSDKTGLIQFPYLILGAVAIFFHVGAQVTGINTIVGYGQSLNLPLLEAKVFPSYILGVTMFGFLLGIFLIPKFLNHLEVLKICTLSALVLSILFFIIHGQVRFLGHTSDISIWALVLLGLSNSLMWSTIWPLALRNLGRFTKIGGSVLILGLCGSAMVPLIYGYLADKFNTRSAYLVLIPCYVFLVFYSFHGYRIKRWSLRSKY